MEETPNQEVTAGQAPGNKWRTVVVAAALAIAMGTAAACSLFHRSHSSTSAGKSKAEPKAKSVMHLEPFVEKSEHGDQSAMSLARTHDTILSILTTCNAEALVSANGKAVLKERLTTALRERAPELGVREIYFTEFLVQR